MANQKRVAVTKTKISTRKEERKLKRVAKKQRNAAYFAKKSRDVEISQDSDSESELVVEAEEEEPVVISAKPSPISKRQKPQLDASAEKRKLEKFAAENPELYETLVKENLVADLIGGVATVTSDELVAKRYAKKLKLKSGKEAASPMFAQDGLDYILDLVDRPKIDDDGSSEGSDAVSDEDSGDDDSEEEQDEMSDEDDLDEEQDEISDDDDLQEEQDEISDAEDDSGGDEAMEDFSELDTEMDSEVASDDVEEAESYEQHEEPAALEKPSAPTGKYIPVHLREKSGDRSEAYARLKRQVQGHLNKLTNSNLESILGSIEHLYQTNARHDMTEIVSNTVLTAVSNSASLLDGFMVVYACFMATLYNVVGTDVGAVFTQSLIEAFDKAYKESKVVAIDSDVASVKTSTNLITLISQLYNFRLISNVLLSGLFRIFVVDLTELDVELILKLIRICGSKLRVEDPISLKEIITALQEKSTSVSGGTGGSRFKFMLEQITNLKNNRGDLCKKAIANDNSGAEDQLKAFMRNFLRKKLAGADKEPLGCSLDDIRNVDTKGKWWVVGAGWVGRQHDDTTLAPLDTRASENSPLYDLARKLNINTDVRRTIFVLLMSSEDHVDAFEKLLKLNLKNKQEREVSRMIFFCCGMEKSYNPFYASIAEKLCKLSHNHKMSFQFTLWDFLKELMADESSVPLRKVENLASMFASLIRDLALPISVLKVLDFSIVLRGASDDDLSKTAKFLQLVLVPLLIGSGGDNERATKDKVLSIFQRIVSVPELSTFRQGLQMSLSPLLKKRKDALAAAKLHLVSVGAKMGSDQLKQLLQDRLEMVKSTLAVSLLT